MKHKKFIIGNVIGIVAAAAVLVTVNVLALGTELRQALTTYFGGSGVQGGDTEGDAYVHAGEVVDQIMDEGMVLLKNENNALPFTIENEEEGINVNVFGINTINMYYGGSGSGDSSVDDPETYLASYEAAGINYNQDIIDLMQAEVTAGRVDTNVGNPLQNSFYPARPALDVSLYNANVASYKQFSDIALINIGRTGGEGMDLPAGEAGDQKDNSGRGVEADYLELSDNEAELIEWAGQNFGTVVVCLNIANPMELSILDEDYVDAVVWIGHPGAYGLSEVGKLLTGEVNPSGRTVDTFARDSKSSPAYLNSNMRYTYSYTNSPQTYYVDYSEGIYVGYRYYETKYANDEKGYDAAVQYPFGYGLSYTDFSWKVTGQRLGNDDKISIDVEVTNDGDMAGKDVVELYVTPPYINGEIEKAHKNLIAFEKTPMIEPHSSATVTLECSVRELASYDYDDANNDGHEGYELEDGNYILSVSSNAHDIKAGVDPITYTVNQTVYYDTTEYTGYDIENRFEDAMTDGSTQYMTRADNLTSNFPVATRTAREASQKVLDAIAHQEDIVDEPTDQYPTTGTITHKVRAEERDENGDIVYDEDGNIVYATAIDDDGNEIEAMRGLYLEDMAGLDYDDPLWEGLLNQLTVAEMTDLIADGGYQTAAVPSINKDVNRDLDGPQGFNFSNVSYEKLVAMSYPSEIVVGSTWNKELAQMEGEAFGMESNEMGVTGLYAPAVNIHRNPYAGRNFEYYSEDPHLSGKMGAHFVIGAQSQGLNCYVKHFAVNDQEAQRYGLFTYLDEQALREIYLKPFQITVEEGKTRCIMSSFNRIGTTWAGASYALLTEVLRNEWGFQGCVITDYYMNYQAFMNPDQGLRAGNDLWLTGLTFLGRDPSMKSATSQVQARRACKNILYSVANARAHAVEYQEPWLAWFIPVDVILWVAVAAWAGLITWKALKLQKQPEEVEVAKEA